MENEKYLPRRKDEIFVVSVLDIDNEPSIDGESDEDRQGKSVDSRDATVRCDKMYHKCDFKAEAIISVPTRG